MGTITVVGLGPGDPRHLTLEALHVLEQASSVWLRTVRHPTVEGLPDVPFHSFDALYDEAEDFSHVYREIAHRLLELAERPRGVVYAVPGHPLVGEAAVQRVLQEARAAGIQTHVVPGLSFVEPTLTALGIDALDGLQVLDAIELSRRSHPPLNPDVPALAGQLYSRSLAAAVKLTLMNQYPDDHQVALVDAAGTPEQRVVRLPLYQLDRQSVTGSLPTHLTALYVPPLGGVASFEGLQDTVARLRAPGGCPWDREQTHESLRASLLEEAYESVAAIDRGDSQALREELGDLLLQVVMQAQIATEGGTFKMPQVIAAIDAKLKHRHPHVWGEATVADTAEVLHNWEELKRQEKGERRSVLEGVPKALPALQQADTYGQRVARVGFDWSDVEGVVAKVREEIAELQTAPTRERQEAELGDLLFAVANWARWLGVDPETALRKANARFARRFAHLERTARERGLELGQLSIHELERFWEDAKGSEDGP